MNKVFSMISLACKAGKVVSGEFSTEKAVKEGKAKLVIVAFDASSNTKKKFSDMCKFYHTDLCIYGKKDELGHCIGKECRASIGIVDYNLARSIAQKINHGG